MNEVQCLGEEKSPGLETRRDIAKFKAFSDKNGLKKQDIKDFMRDILQKNGKYATEKVEMDSLPFTNLDSL
jgi:hypothetical protein